MGKITIVYVFVLISIANCVPKINVSTNPEIACPGDIVGVEYSASGVATLDSRFDPPVVINPPWDRNKKNGFFSFNINQDTNVTLYEGTASKSRSISLFGADRQDNIILTPSCATGVPVWQSAPLNFVSPRYTKSIVIKSIRAVVLDRSVTFVMPTGWSKPLNQYQTITGFNERFVVDEVAAIFKLADVPLLEGEGCPDQGTVSPDLRVRMPPRFTIGIVFGCP